MKYDEEIIKERVHSKPLCIYSTVFLQAISKIHLTPNYGIVRLFKMLTYSPCMLRFFIGSRRVLERNLHF
jgi:hypothetical protein